MSTEYYKTETSLNSNSILIFIASFSTILLQLLQMKYLNVILDPTSGFMILTLALLLVGFGGALFQSIKIRFKIQSDSLIYITQILFLITASICLFSIRQITYLPDIIKLSRHFVLSTIILLIVSIPYFFSGISLAGLLFSEKKQKFNITDYSVDMFGIVLASVTPIFFVPILGPEKLMALALTMHFVLFIATVLKSEKIRLIEFFRIKYGLHWFVCLSILFFNLYLIFFTTDAEPMNTLIRKYKPNNTGSVVEYSGWDVNSRVDIVDLKRNSASESKVKYLFYDGGTIGTNIYKFDGDYEKLKLQFHKDPESYFLRRAAVAAHLIKEGANARVYLFGVGAGQELKAALMYSPSEVIANELVSTVVALSQNRYADYNGKIFNDPRVKVLIGDGRLGLKKQEGHFDVIQIFSNYLSANMSAGLSPFLTTYLFTEEALIEYLAKLKPDGILQINQLGHVKILNMLKKIWRDNGYKTNLKEHIFVIENKKKFDILTTLIFKKSPFTESDFDKLKYLFNQTSASYEEYEFIESPFAQVKSDELSVQKSEAQLTSVKRVITDDRPFFLYEGQSLFNSYGLNKNSYRFFNLIIFVFSFFLLLGRKKESGLGFASALSFFVSGFLYVLMQYSMHSKLIKHLDIPSVAYPIILMSLALSSIIAIIYFKKMEVCSKLQRKLNLFFILSASLGTAMFFDKILNFFSLSMKSVFAMLFVVPLCIFLGLITASLFPLASKLILNSTHFRSAWLFNCLGVMFGALLSHRIGYELGLDATFMLSLASAAIILFYLKLKLKLLN